MSLVSLDRVAKTYGTAAARVHALHGVTLTIAARIDPAVTLRTE
jgi:hypothetical protein